MNNLVSIVVTCYNHEKYIEEALKSVFAQTYKNIELIIINDGSTDLSEEVIRKVILHSPFENTVLQTQNNSGLVVARNHALKLIQGDFVVFLDSDDALDESYVEETLKVAQANCADIVYTKMVNLETQETVLSVTDFNLAELYYGNFIHAASLIRVSKIENNIYDIALNYKKLEDYDFFFSLIVNNGAKAVPSYKTHLNYRILSNSMSDRENRSKYYDSYLYILSKYFSSNPKLAQIALNKHVNHLLELDIEKSIREEFITVSIMDGKDEEIIYKEKIKSQDAFIIDLKEEFYKKTLRIRPSNIPSFYDDFSVVAIEKNTVLPIKLTNGNIIQNVIVFRDFYPFLDYELINHLQGSLLISYKRSNISDITSENYIAKKLATIIQNKEEVILEQAEKIKQYKRELEASRDSYEKVNKQYHEVVGSRRWIYPTKIINLFRRTK